MITIYSNEGCSLCKQAAMILSLKKIPHEVKMLRCSLRTR